MLLFRESLSAREVGIMPASIVPSSSAPVGCELLHKDFHRLYTPKKKVPAFGRSPQYCCPAVTISMPEGGDRERRKRPFGACASGARKGE